MLSFNIYMYFLATSRPILPFPMLGSRNVKYVPPAAAGAQFLCRLLRLAEARGVRRQGAGYKFIQLRSILLSALALVAYWLQD